MEFYLQKLELSSLHMSNALIQCCICHYQDQQTKQLCCPSALSCCITCIMNGAISPQTQCPRCKRQVGKRFKKILSEIMDHNSMINANRQGRKNQNRHPIMNNSMILTQKKPQAFINQQGQKIMNIGSYYPPHQGYINQNFPYYPPYQIPYYQQNFQNWQPNNYYGQHIPYPMMMAQFQYAQFPQKRCNNYQAQNDQFNGVHSSYSSSYCNDKDLEQIVTQKMMKSGQRRMNLGISRNQDHYEDSPQEMPRHLYHGQMHSQAYQHESKTTDILEQTTQNKFVRLNRSNSVNHLTLRR